MPIETFNFPYHRFETQNPESGFRGKFGGSYIFTSEPDAPDMRVFKLSFKAMIFYVGEDGFPEPVTNPTLNMKTLIDFYHIHKLHKTFYYNHPVYGILTVKFAKPLPEPKGVEGGTGVVEAFEIELIEQP